MRIRWFLGALILIALWGFMGCSGSDTTDSSDKLAIVATTGMIGDAVRVIAGDDVMLDVLMGPGVDPHLYKTSKGDLDLLDGADVIFYNGLNLEAKMGDILGKMSRSKTTVPAAEAIPDSLLTFPSGYEGHPDPHVWFDLSLWRHAVEAVGLALENSDTANAAHYRAATGAYLDTLAALHTWVDSMISTIPEPQRVLVTAHDAFGYFGRAYGIEVEGLQGISTVTEAGLYDVTEMVTVLVDREIKAVFVESSVSRKAINSVVEGCRSRGHEVVIGGELYSDAMGERGTVEGTFVGMVRHNVNTIVEALR